MRLNGRAEILAYLGRRWNPNHRQGWRKVRSLYLPVLHYLHGGCWVWTTSEEIDELDRKRSLTLDEVLAAKAKARGACVKGDRQGSGSRPGLLFLKLQRELYPGMQRGKKA